MSETRKKTIKDIYDITTALLTDNDTTFITNKHTHLIKTIPGASYLLTIQAPTNSITHLINSGEATNTPENTYALENGPRGKITLYCNGRLLGEYTTQGPIGPSYTERDNFIKRFIRKMHEHDFFKIVDLINCRKQGKIVLRDNTNIFHELLKSQKTK